MSLEKLQNLLNEKQKKNSAAKVEFKDLICIYTGVQSAPYYEKLKDGNGKDVKDKDGKIVRSSELKGYMYTFNELGTAKVVKIVVTNKDMPIKLLSVYKIKGDGYDIKNGNMIFLDENVGVTNYE